MNDIIILAIICGTGISWRGLSILDDHLRAGRNEREAARRAADHQATMDRMADDRHRREDRRAAQNGEVAR